MEYLCCNQSEKNFRNFSPEVFLISDTFMRSVMAADFKNGYLRVASALIKHIMNTENFRKKL